MNGYKIVLLKAILCFIGCRKVNGYAPEYVLIALPNLMPLISKAKSTEAQQQLVFLHTLQKSHFYTNSRYSTSLSDLDFEQAKLVTDGGNANYKIEIIEANEKGFRARATAVVDFDGDGEYNVWEINQDKELKEITKD